MPKPDRYHADLSKISLDDFADSLRTRKMIPSRLALKDDLEHRFTLLKARGLKSMADVLSALKAKVSLALIASETGLSLEYLNLLRREINSYLPSPVVLSKIPGVDSQLVGALAAVGITNSRHLFRSAATRATRTELAASLGEPSERLDELICLSDLSRLYGVGPVFARLLYDAGFHTVETLRSKTAEDLVALYEERTGKPADFGAHEVQVTLEMASVLDAVVEI